MELQIAIPIRVIANILVRTTVILFRVIALSNLLLRLILFKIIKYETHTY